MSAGFRAFLLILLTFGAVWAYQFRSADLKAWLGHPLPAATEVERDPSGGSPVDELPRIDGSSLIDVTFQGWTAPRPRRSPPAPEGWRSPWTVFGQEEPIPSHELEDDVTAEESRPWADPPNDSGFDLDYVGMERVVGKGEIDTEDEIPQDGSTDVGESTVPPPPVDPNPPVAYEEFTYTFQEGDSLWKVAEKHLGSGARAAALLDLNRDVLQGVDPARIPIGTKLRIQRPIRQESLKNPPAQVDTTVEAGSGPGGPTLHEVKRNENLQKIARKYYPGDSEGWKRIYEANREQLLSPDQIRQGQLLKVPSATRR